MTDQNSEQALYWSEQAGPKWVELQAFIDAQLEPLGLEAMSRLGAIEGSSVLDVGCGCGATSLELARRVGAGGTVVGIDLSAPMLARARASAASAELAAGLTFLEADAQSRAFETAFDAIFSRFGVMFFSDPKAAFANLGRAARSGARLSFACWRGVEDNEWMTVPVAAALQHLPPPEIPAPGAPGPFAFADGDRLRRILEEADFGAVAIDRFDTKVAIGAGRSLEETVRVVMQMGPTGRLLQEASDDVKERVAASIAEALQPFQGDNGLRMSASTWMVTAEVA